jgi:hypothetical protein
MNRIIVFADLLFMIPGATKDSLLFANLELNIGIITASIAVLRPLFRRLIPSVFGASWPEPQEW